MIHPDTRLVGIDAVVGVGVVATQAIPAGTLIWVRDRFDQRLSPAEFATLPEVLRERVIPHAYPDDEEHWVLTWDSTRYMNHACDYNTVVTPWGMEIACRSIAQGEQLSNDYAFFQLAPHEEFDCRCGAANCRGRVDSRHPALYRPAQEQRLATAIGQVMQVKQALWPLLSAQQVSALEEAVRDAA